MGLRLFSPLVLKWLLRGAIVFAVWFMVHCAVITVDGFSDLEGAGPADAAVVLGNQVFKNGTPSKVLTSRLAKALEVYQSGGARHIVCSGGKGPGNLWEAVVMRDWLVARGVDPAAISVDNDGKDSYGTAREAKKLFDARGWKSALIVTHFTHITRCKLAFRRFGLTDIRTTHADASVRDILGFPHEFLGYYYYWLRRY